MRFTPIFFLLTIPIAAPSQAADPAYTIKLYKSKPGDVVKETQKASGETAVTVTPTGQPTQKEVMKEGEHYQFTETILEKPDGAERATRLTRTYETAEKTERGKPRTLAYHGKTVLIAKEKGKDKYTFTVDGKALPDEDAKELDKKYNQPEADRGPTNQDFMPAKPVKVGDTWTVDTTKAVKSLRADKLIVDQKKAKITGKLVKTYKKGDAQFGVMEIEVDMPLTAGEIGGTPVDYKPGSVMRFKLTVDCCIDGSTPGEVSTADISLSMSADLPNVTVAVIGKMTGSGKIEPAPRK